MKNDQYANPKNEKIKIKKIKKIGIEHPTLLSAQKGRAPPAIATGLIPFADCINT